jgi:hypothetical protein
MYIKKVEIKNVRSISKFEMEFADPAGWHVLIGDNGAGKSSILRSIALALIGPTDAQALRLPLINWIQQSKEEAEITLLIERSQDLDGYAGKKAPLKKPFDAAIRIFKENAHSFDVGRIERKGKSGTNPFEYIWSGKGGWFSTAFGPFRRFTGGDKEWSKVYYSNPRAAAHLSVFGEDVALTESLEWLSQMKFQTFEAISEAASTLEGIKRFINKGGLLPHGAQLDDVNSAGVFFKDGNGFDIDVTQMSDGFRSLLSMIFELIRQMVKIYDENLVFENINNGEMTIGVPGIVLIDEVDAHLHPTWQTRIGQWFTQYFPNIQFLVTTHSPLVCRASDKGSIWRLAAPGSETKSGEITGVDKDRLIFGNVLDAYGTEVFGSNVTISEDAVEKKEEMVELNKKKMAGVIKPEEESKLEGLRQTFTTDDPIDL